MSDFSCKRCVVTRALSLYAHSASCIAVVMQGNVTIITSTERPWKNQQEKQEQRSSFIHFILKHKNPNTSKTLSHTTKRDQTETTKNPFPEPKRPNTTSQTHIRCPTTHSICPPMPPPRSYLPFPKVFGACQAQTPSPRNQRGLACWLGRKGRWQRPT